MERADRRIAGNGLDSRVIAAQRANVGVPQIANHRFVGAQTDGYRSFGEFRSAVTIERLVCTHPSSADAKDIAGLKADTLALKRVVEVVGCDHRRRERI